MLAYEADAPKFSATTNIFLLREKKKGRESWIGGMHYSSQQTPLLFLSPNLLRSQSTFKRVMRPTFFIDNLEVSTNNSSQAETGGQATTIHSSYNCSDDDPNFNGLFTAYGPQPQLVGFSTARLPLPFDVADDGLIFVNAKQYHGILRRRQMRAKLVAQKRLLKTRKPYMHESRHLHAVNRVRGSGGRFLSSKKAQHHHHESPSSSSANSVEASMSATAP